MLGIFGDLRGEFAGFVHQLRHHAGQQSGHEQEPGKKNEQHGAGAPDFFGDQKINQWIEHVSDDPRDRQRPEHR